MEEATLLADFFSRAWYWFLDNFSASYTRRILIEALQLLGQLWPYLLLGILLTTAVKMVVSKDKLAGFLNKRSGKVSIPLAALLGVISPLGSYVIIPLSAALYAVGIPLPPLMALMIASPLINPNLFVLTAGAMGMEMAVMRTLSALLLGMAGGYITYWIMVRRKTWFKDLLREQNLFLIDNPAAAGQKKTLRVFMNEFIRMTKYISKYFFLAIILAAVIKILVNPNYIVRLFSDNNFLAVLFTTAAGVPFYVCGGAAIPVVQSLAELGMSKGAVLAFFISGPVSKLSNLIILNAAFRTTLLIHYLAVGIGGALIFGLVYNLFP
ncbi:MAG: permease [Bacteroidales bacterium]|nr:permease [Bacteroidales bacterium]